MDRRDPYSSPFTRRATHVEPNVASDHAREGLASTQHPGGKWESEAVGELQALQAHLRWKRRPVLAWVVVFFALAFYVLYTTWPNAILPATPKEGLWFSGGALVAGVCMWNAIRLARGYFRATPSPSNLSRRQRALLGLPSVAADEVTRRQPTGRVVESSMVSPLGSPPSRYRPSYASPPPPSPVRDLHRVAVTRRLHQPSPAGKLGELEVITDQRGLDRYLQRSPLEERTETGFAGLTNQLAASPGFGTAAVSPYRVSPRSSPSKGRTGDEFGYFNTQAAQELVDRLGIESWMEEWTERTRQWLLEHVIWPLVRDIEEVTKAGLLLTKPLPQAASQTAAAMTSSAPTSMWYSFQSAPQPTATSYTQNPVVQKRQNLEKYMDVHGSPSREYIVQRIKQLAEGGCMAAFKWNGGGSWQGKPWTTELPTDSQILIHLFCAYMDGFLPADPRAEKNKPFSSLYYVLAPKSPGSFSPVLLAYPWDSRLPIVDSVPTSAKIYQSHVHPPHFKVLYQQEVWDTFQGRNNLFHAIFLWTYAVQTKLDGYIGQVHLNETGLNQIIHLDT